MNLTADFHTHTVYSHGKGTVLENAERAKELGLQAIGITDHGFSHLIFGIKRKKIPSLVRDCREAEQKTGVKVLVGIESNIRGRSGLCDLKKSDFENFDLYLAGIHICIRDEKCSDMKINYGGYLRKKFKRKPSRSMIRATTEAYINAVKKNPVDVITHLNYKCFADAVEVAKCCRDYGTYLEISSKKTHLTDEELEAVAATGVRFLIDSDAHSIDRIGEAALAETQIMRVGIPLSQIDNIEGRMPTLRFTEFKKHL